MKKIVFLSVLGFGCAFADAADTTDVVTNEAAVNEQVNCECDGAKYSGFYGGLDVLLGRIHQDARLVGVMQNGNYYHANENLIKKNGVTVEGRLCVGGSKVIDSTVLGVECALDIGGKRKRSDEDDQLKYSMDALRPEVLVFAGWFSKCLNALVTVGAGVCFIKTIYDYTDGKGTTLETKKKTTPQPMISLGLVKNVAEFRGMRVALTGFVKHVFGKRKEVTFNHKLGQFDGASFNGEVSKTTFGVGVRVRI